MNYETQNAAEEMFVLADQLRALREEKVQAEAHLKELNAEIERTDLALSDRMAESETQNFTRAGMMFCRRDGGDDVFQLGLRVIERGDYSPSVRFWTARSSAHLPQPGEKRNCSLPCGRPDTAT